MSFVEYFKGKILPDIIQSGCLGENPKVLNVEDLSEGRDEFMSSVKFVNLKLQVGEISETVPLFCKFENESTMERKREDFQTDLQFFNEVFMYKEIISSYPKPVSNTFPIFYYGTTSIGKSSEPSVIILENLIAKGYQETQERVFLDFEHCYLAFKKLGEFHGASLQMKAKDPLKFENNVNQLVETKWVEKRKEMQKYFYGETCRRGVKPLLEKGEHIDILNDFSDRLNNVHTVVKDIFEVNEHSVLCHGDFCRNNMVFKYPNSQGHPTDVKFYDLGTARYASSIIDISFFLFLNSNADLRHKHFRGDLLNTYLDGVKKYAGSVAPTMEELWKEFQKRAVYGYLLSSFFLPIMWHGGRDPDNVSLEEMTKLNLLKGGQEVTDILSDIVKDLVSWGCLEKTD